METLAIRRRDGGAASLDADQLAALQADLHGRIVTQADADYEPVRAVWNGMVERRPALIVRCAGTADVVRCVRLAAERELLTSIRGGGHHIAGTSLADGGLCIDLSMLREVYVDPRARTARVSPGATLADFDAEAQAFGLATALGINSTTGVAGLTLGGGFGWLSRTLGYTVDNLLSADVVTADGALRTANDEENPDLFWALRGGGGNFGVVTSLEFKLHPVGPQVLAGLIVHRFEDAPRVLEEYRRFTDSAPDEVAVWLVIRKAPPLPFIPANLHGREVLILAVMDSGRISDAQRRVAPVRRIGQPVADVVGPMRFRDWQRAFDPLLTAGARNYWKSHNFTSFPPELISTVLDFAGRLPSQFTEIFVGQLGGATERLPSDATAYPHRDARFVMNVHTRWIDKANDAECVAWAREFFRATAPYATGGVYVNFEDESRAAAAYAGNYDRLAELKRRYDPDNLFRVNMNIRPEHAPAGIGAPGDGSGAPPPA